MVLPHTIRQRAFLTWGLLLSMAIFLASCTAVVVVAVVHASTTPATHTAASATDQQVAALESAGRPDSLLRVYIEFQRQLDRHQQAGDTPQQIETFEQTFWASQPTAVLVKLIALAVFAGLLGLLVLGLCIYGLVRLATGPSLARRWQRWQRGVVSPLPMWMLLAVALGTFVALILVRQFLPATPGMYTLLGTWEAAQALTLVVLLGFARRDGLKPEFDFGFGRAPKRSTVTALKYYFALLPLFWLLALVGKTTFVAVDSAAGSPSLHEEAGRVSIEQLMGQGSLGPIVLFVAAVILAPIMEELFFRGFLYGALRRWMGAPAAVVLSAAIFASLHPTPNHLPIFFLGMYLAYNYEKSGNLGSSMAVHLMHNLIQTILMGLVML
ncbi:MAG: lysostaphin resistance A-like protein [Planctomycetota bacterium]